MKKINSFIVLLIAVGVTFSYLFISCKKTDIVTATTTDVNIYSYLRKDTVRFSKFVQIIDKSGYSDFLDAYGSYTCFAPDNNAVDAYLQDVSKASVESLTETEAKDIVKLHLIQDTLNTNSFKDGKLPQITMFGQYLLTGVANKDGVSRYTVNRTAFITQANIKLANGSLHVIDHVLKPATKTLAQLVEQDPNFSIFTQALKETGFYDSLNIVNNPDTTRRFLTLIAESNKVLRDSGFATYAALKARYSKTGNPKNNADSLHLYVAYHILTDARYVADIVTTSSLPTLAPLEVITPTLDGETVLLNDIVFNGFHEQGIILDRVISDIGATNGVLHYDKAHFAIKTRVPVRVDWDVADVPEIRKLTSVFRKSTPAIGTPGGFSLAVGSIKDITWETTAGQTVAYAFTGTTSTSFYGWWGDYIVMPMGLTNSARAKWYEFRSPLIVKGRYKVWIGYRYSKQSASNPAFPLRVLFDGEPLQRTFRFEEALPSGTAGELEAIGWKSYTSDAVGGQIANHPSRLVGTIDVKSTDRHIIRFEATTGSGQSSNYLDMIQFIPVNDNQVSPTFARDGRVLP